MSNQIMPTYARLPVKFTKGKGIWLWDDQDNCYLDALSGIGVCGLGHTHPEIAAAITDQAQKLIHTSNLYEIPSQADLARSLCDISGMDAAFFCNSGAEAVEAAIKIARKFGKESNLSNPTIIVCDNSFHGRTMATLSATGNRKVHAGFEPLVQGFVRVPFNSIDAIKTVAQSSTNVVAILVEPIQGEGGIQVPSPDYLQQIRKICDEQNWLLMLDEIQTGMGRTGEWFAFQHNQVTPDVMTIAKGLGNGFPVGACLTKGRAASLFSPGNHGSTFGGNPLACHIGLSVINSIQSSNILENCKTQGAYLIHQLNEKLGVLDCIKQIRGEGLMIGIELDRPCMPLAHQALQDHLLISIQTDNVIRLLPPLIITKEECDIIVNRLLKILSSIDEHCSKT